MSEVAMDIGGNAAARRHDIPADLLAALTRSPVKARMFAADNYFREATWTFGDHVQDVLGIASCVLKPDAAVGRRYGIALQALREHGFTPVDVLRVRHNRLTIRETWRFQLNFADRHRIATMDLYLRSLDSVLLILRDDRHRPGGVPGSVRLASLKGPATARLRRPEHLRERLGAINGLFNFLHTTDEPLDVLRDLSVLLPPADRERVLRRICSPRDVGQECAETFAAIEAVTEPHDLDVGNSWKRLSESDAPVGDLSRRQRAGERISAVELLAAAHHPDAQPSEFWDLLTVLTDTVRFNVPDIERLYPNVLLEAWQEAV
ncbi:hypothetical protein ACQPWW_22215 [Micromonospora sp. CA-240977]|uniref:hypothetical protein n=1 Tax=Micromonospora sp. CA-240977 TaxID=3239957 RepID=UPI003D8EE2BB